MPTQARQTGCTLMSRTGSVTRMNASGHKRDGNSPGTAGTGGLTHPPVPSLADFAGLNVLLLQGPFGPFFRRLAKDLRTNGATVRRVCFNGGDWFFHPDADLVFTGTLAEWPALLAHLLDEWRVDAVMLYADCRPVHEPVFPLCERRGIEVFSFEEGYWRPDHVTLERGRTNAASSLPRGERFLAQWLPRHMPRPQRWLRRTALPRTAGHQKLWAALYHIAAALLAPLMPPRTYHRGIGAPELWPQIRSLWRYHHHRWAERGVQEMLLKHAGREGYFLVPLQVPVDFQLRCHSDYDGIEPFIEEVTRSFAAHAPAGTLLVFKQHPQDRGYNCYRAFVESAARAAGIADRVLYIHDQHLPTLLDNARGVIVINSTVGLSALIHDCPLKTMGRAIYDLPGLVADVPLDDFWRQSERFRPDRDRLRLFMAWLVRCTQLNGSFYRCLRGTGNATGLAWADPPPTAAMPVELERAGDDVKLQHLIDH